MNGHCKQTRGFSRAQRRARGFTLLEVIVALAVLAIALAAVIEGITAYVGNTAYLRDRTLAHWVAMNKAAELQLQKAWPSAGSTRGSTLLADHEWFWTVVVFQTEDDDVRRADIEVSERDGGQALTKLITYIGQPL